MGGHLHLKFLDVLIILNIHVIYPGEKGGGEEGEEREEREYSDV